MQVRSSSHNNDLGIAWITEIRGQLPLSWAVPADVEEDLYHNKYYDNSAKMNIDIVTNLHSKMIISDY